MGKIEIATHIGGVLSYSLQYPSCGISPLLSSTHTTFRPQTVPLWKGLHGKNESIHVERRCGAD